MFIFLGPCLLSLVTSRKNLPTENPSGNVRQDSGAFLLTTELFERVNQIVARPITRAAHWRTSTCADANW